MEQEPKVEEWRKGSQLERQKHFNVEKGEKGAKRAGKGQWSKTGGRKGETGQEKGAKVTPEFAGAVGKQDTLRWTAPRRVGTRV